MRESDSGRLLTLASLVFAGEMIFSLPFHVARYFRPTLLEVFALDNATLGDIFAVYGITAMLAYFPGGVLADRFSARGLMVTSLLATAAGGVVLARIPDETGLMWLFAFWGITSILLFWAAMIKATRQWGGQMQQGRAFGWLDGGRGIAAAGMASVAVWILGLSFPSDITQLTPEQRLAAIRQVIWFYTVATASAAVMIAWLLQRGESAEQSEDTPRNGFHVHGLMLRMRQLMTLPGIAWQSLVVVAAYCAYKGIDYYGLYAVDVLAMDEVESARLTAALAWMRPVGAVAAGYWIDTRLSRWSRPDAVSGVLVRLFACVIMVNLLIAGLTGWGQNAALWLVLMVSNLFVSVLAIYAMRGIYFALLQETRVPAGFTGSAVGLISVLGFSPDIFFAPIAGRIVDTTRDAAAHQILFLLLAVIALAGLLASWRLSVLARSGQD